MERRPPSSAGTRPRVIFVLLNALALLLLSAPTPTPQDTLLDVGGYRLHLVVHRGTIPLTIVMESGGGASLDDWAGLDSALARSTGATVVAYDRAGFGGSDMGPADLTAEQQVRQLNLALERLGTPSSRLVIGHSYGGMLAVMHGHLYRRTGPWAGARGRDERALRESHRGLRAHHGAPYRASGHGHGFGDRADGVRLRPPGRKPTWQATWIWNCRSSSSRPVSRGGASRRSIGSGGRPMRPWRRRPQAAASSSPSAPGTRSQRIARTRSSTRWRR